MTDRAERVLERIRDIPPGFVRTYGDVSPGAPRFAGTVLSETDDPESRGSASCAPTARWPRARASARCSTPRACRSGATVSTRRGTIADLMWLQRQITLRPRERGFHLVTREIVDGVPELADLRVGLAHVFIRHTSASLTLNENASPDVRRDFETWFSNAVSESDRWGTPSRAPTTCPPTSRRRCWARP